MKVSLQVKETFMSDVLSILPQEIRELVASLEHSAIAAVEEIRLRKGKPLIIRSADREIYLRKNKKRADSLAGAYTVTDEDIRELLQAVSRGSIYALEEEFKNGYITIRGGHRIGFAGEAVMEKGSIKTLKNISSLNIRIAREFPGCAEPVLPYIIENGRVKHTLIVSPPGCGKTTILRDIICQLSSGILSLRFKGINVGLVDERSEIAASYNGVPQLDVGPRTDVLGKCSKARGMLMLIRSMAPQVIATDELGREEDIAACKEILNAGITLIATAHASGIEEIKKRPGLNELLISGMIQRIVVLDRKPLPGSICHIFNSKGMDIYKSLI